ncbi:MAG: hypothetical protein K2J20_05295, partial [Bacilli bacterium]|nr:hypothetical protein [Bacilli bacterium]
MAKTKKKQKIVKNMKLEQNELVSLTIGISDNKKSGSIGTFLVLTIFVLVVVFLPQLSDMVEAYLHPEVQVPNTPMTPPKPDKPTEDDNNDDDDKDYSAEFYDFSNALV